MWTCLLLAPITIGLIGLIFKSVTVADMTLLVIAGMVFVSISRGRLLGSSVRIHERQLPELHRIVDEVARRLGIEQPQIFVRDDPLRADRRGGHRLAVRAHPLEPVPRAPPSRRAALPRRARARAHRRGPHPRHLATQRVGSRERRGRLRVRRLAAQDGVHRRPRGSAVRGIARRCDRRDLHHDVPCHRAPHRHAAACRAEARDRGRAHAAHGVQWGSGMPYAASTLASPSSRPSRTATSHGTGSGNSTGRSSASPTSRPRCHSASACIAATARRSGVEPLRSASTSRSSRSSSTAFSRQRSTRPT